jgi:hypothetical protein
MVTGFEDDEEGVGDVAVDETPERSNHDQPATCGTANRPNQPSREHGNRDEVADCHNHGFVAAGPARPAKPSGSEILRTDLPCTTALMAKRRSQAFGLGDDPVRGRRFGRATLHRVGASRDAKQHVNARVALVQTDAAHVNPGRWR